MQNRLLELALKKQRLEMRCANERAGIARYAAGLSPVWQGLDLALAARDWTRRHPGAVLLATVVAFVVRPRLIVRWVFRGITLWRTLGRFRNGAGLLAGLTAYWRNRF